MISQPQQKLYRAVYLRHGRVKGMTFAARNAALAAQFAYTVVQGFARAVDPAAQVLTVNEVRK